MVEVEVSSSGVITAVLVLPLSRIFTQVDLTEPILSSHGAHTFSSRFQPIHSSRSKHDVQTMSCHVIFPCRDSCPRTTRTRDKYIRSYKPIRPFAIIMMFPDTNQRSSPPNPLIRPALSLLKPTPSLLGLLCALRVTLVSLSDAGLWANPWPFRRRRYLDR